MHSLPVLQPAFWRIRRVGLSVAALALGVDILSKQAVLAATAAGHLPWWLLARQWGLELHWNTGMSFSLLQNTTWGPLLLAGVAVGASLWFIKWLGESPAPLHQLGVGLVLGGALGNLLDRLTHGAVVDFVLTSPWGYFPYAYNLADTCLTVGVALLLLQEILTRKAN